MTECTIWTGGQSMGYGEINQYPKAPIRVHRWVYLTFVGPIPKGYHVHHACHVKLCINPDHLELLSQTEHFRLHNPRPTHCKRGHELTPENRYVRPDGEGGFCKICAQMRHKVGYSYQLKRRAYVCQECGTEYVGNASKYQFCSNSCRCKAAYRRRAA